VKPASNRFEDITVVFNSPSNVTDNLTTVNVKIVPNIFSPNIDLENVLNSMISNSIKWKVPSFGLEEDVECKKYNFTGKQACSFVYTPESKTAFLQTTTNVGDTEYTITYSAPVDYFDAQMPIAERMIGSFNITNISGDNDEQLSAPETEANVLTILEGSSIIGNPAYDPDQMTVRVGDTIAVDNEDSSPHTVTNGKGATDPNMGKLFDTSIINAGDSSEIVTTDLQPGEYPFFCAVHPYMTGTLIVQ
jgi:plastocyanin